ncbi:hypothetical protein POVCU2_0080700 [Plasmodium ovale curtisi]|uniref:Uncharacterized protein n=1 Tax=Plasmodium ovale curtisi TaxID=864141 RepID=A0A1A8WMD5_PLAOA|nr:hypothetical protein POVCU1_005590 [Plasmodium ovale curtisi]SBS93373.1 hypothetical protein POVCU2_0080700 [Plasmodium ovale curtisi]
MLCNEILAKSFQTMISYVLTISFFTLLNLYISNSYQDEKIAGFDVAVSVITLLASVLDAMSKSNSLDYFCIYSIGMKN